MSYAIYPGVNFKAVTPSDTEKLKPFTGSEIKRCQFIIVGVAGNVAIANEDGTTVTLVGLQAGGQYAVSTDQILSTGTTATNIVAAFDSTSQFPRIVDSTQ